MIAVTCVSLLLAASAISAQTTFGEPLQPRIGDLENVSAGDLDGDGDADLVANAGPADAITLLRHGVGPWSAEPLVGLEPAEVAGLADVDGDGDLDILIERDWATGFGDGSVAWLENVTGGADVWTEHLLFGTWYDDLTVALGDWEGDGDVDVFVTYEDSGSFDEGTFLCENTGAPGLWPIRELLLFKYPLQIADLDGDGDADLTLSTIWWENTYPGPSLVQQEIPSPCWWFESFVVADTDGDADLDILSLCSSVLHTSENLGGADTWTTTELFGLAPGIDVHDMAAADFDGDGAEEVVLLVRSVDGDPAGAHLVLLDRDPAAPSGWTWRRLGVERRATEVQAVDVTGDGVPDILLTGSNAPTVIYPGMG